jgi:hypothetical protein
MDGTYHPYSVTSETQLILEGADIFISKLQRWTLPQNSV